MNVLAKIKAHKVDEVRALKASGALTRFEAACRRLPPPRDFAGAIADKYADDKVALIAEIKKASPSKGVIRSDFNVCQIARAYRDGGAACLSVLTDEHFFQGHGDFVAQAANVSGLPVLRKDFLIDPIQAFEARMMGADCVLLILAMIDDAEARDLEAVARELSLDVLIEVHNEPELDRALVMQSRLIGINNRDLTTFEADLGISMRLARRIGDDRLVVSESGIAGPGDVARLLDYGVRAFLVGESLLKSADLETATRQISGCLKETENGYAFADH